MTQAPASDPAAAATPGRAADQRRRTVLAGAAGMVLIVLGVGGLFEAFAAFALNGFANMDGGTNIPLSMQSFLVVGAILAVYGLAGIIGGIGVLLGGSWGRVIGLAVAIVGTIALLPGLLSQTDPNGLGVAVIVWGAHAFAALVLLFRWKAAVRRA